MNMLTNVLLVIIIVLLCGFGVSLFLLLSYLRRTLLDFVTPEAQGQQSPLIKCVDATAQLFGRAITAQIKTTLMGMSSGVVRGEQALQGDLVEGMASQNPIGSLAMSFPALRRSLRRNPALYGLLESAVGRFLGGNHSSGGNLSAGSSSGVKFHL